MTKPVKAVPEGYHTLIPNLRVRGAVQAIEFYKRAFGAQEIMRMAGPDGKTIMHAELKIGDSKFMLSDEFPEMGARSPQSLNGTPVSFYVYVEDVDAVFNRAVAAGAQVKMPVTDMFWGDRYGKLADPFGHEWELATHQQDLTPEEIRKAADAFFAQAARNKP